MLSPLSRFPIALKAPKVSKDPKDLKVLKDFTQTKTSISPVSLKTKNSQLISLLSQLKTHN